MPDADSGFNCDNCHKWVVINEFIGTKNRNHCPFCLWSKHVDDKVSGDRAADCQGDMKPVGLTVKQVGKDKYGKARQGELMLIHICTKCGKISINRLAGDDDTALTMDLLRPIHMTAEEKKSVKKSGIKILSPRNEAAVKTQLFGKT